MIQHEYRTLLGVRTVRKNRALDIVELGDTHVAYASPCAIASFFHWVQVPYHLETNQMQKNTQGYERPNKQEHKLSSL